MGTPERSSITEWLLPGVDPALIERTPLTPTERLEKLESMMAFLREARKTNAALPQDAAETLTPAVDFPAGATHG